MQGIATDSPSCMRSWLSIDLNSGRVVAPNGHELIVFAQATGDIILG